MIELLISAFADAIPALGFVERYGGLVRPVRTKEVMNGTTTADVTYPVSCTVDAACAETSLFKKLVPDSTYKSVAYFEQRGEARATIGGNRMQEVTLTASLRFVAWLNFKQLGIEGCPDTLQFQLAVIKALNVAAFSATNTLLSSPGKVRITRFSLPEQRADAIFAPYSYAAKEWAFFPPYGFFAVDFDAQLTVNLNCFTEPDLLTPVDCITQF